MSNPNDPAYPIHIPADPGWKSSVDVTHNGMTIRQRFVMAAMQGLLSAQMSDGFTWTEIATQACIATDAALAEEARTRSKK